MARYHEAVMFHILSNESSVIMNESKCSFVVWDKKVLVLKDKCYLSRAAVCSPQAVHCCIWLPSPLLRAQGHFPGSVIWINQLNSQQQKVNVRLWFTASFRFTGKSLPKSFALAYRSKLLQSSNQCAPFCFSLLLTTFRVLLFRPQRPTM